MSQRRVSKIHASFEEDPVIYKKSSSRKILVYAKEVIWEEENRGRTWKTSHRCCIMRKVIYKKVTAGGKLDFF